MAHTLRSDITSCTRPHLMQVIAEHRHHQAAGFVAGPGPGLVILGVIHVHQQLNRMMLLKMYSADYSGGGANQGMQNLSNKGNPRETCNSVRVLRVVQLLPHPAFHGPLYEWLY